MCVNLTSRDARRMSFDFSFRRPGDASTYTVELHSRDVVVLRSYPRGAASDEYAPSVAPVPRSAG